MNKFAFTIFLAFSAVYLYAQDTGGFETKSVLSDGLNVRSAPSADSRVLGKLFKGNEVTIFAENGNWSKIMFEGKEGWVPSKYLSAGKRNSNKLINKPPENRQAEEPKSSSNKGIIVFIALVIIAIIIIQFVLFYRCPHCNRFFALDQIGTEILDRYKGSERRTVYRRNKKGEVIGSRDIYVTVTKEKYKDTYRCEYCNGIVNRFGTRTLE